VLTDARIDMLRDRATPVRFNSLTIGEASVAPFQSNPSLQTGSDIELASVTSWVSPLHPLLSNTRSKYVLTVLGTIPSTAAMPEGGCPSAFAAAPPREAVKIAAVARCARPAGAQGLYGSWSCTAAELLASGYSSFGEFVVTTTLTRYDPAASRGSVRFLPKSRYSPGA
jgi:hypothetical protein